MRSSASVSIVTSQYTESAREKSKEAVRIWSPVREHARASQVQAVPKVRSIEVRKTSASSDIVTRLKATRLGAFYVHRLKRYAIIRWVAIQVWRNGYPFYVNRVAIRFGNRNTKRWRPLVRLRSLVERRSTPFTRIAAESKLEMPAPRVIPGRERECLTSSRVHRNFPDIYVAIVSNATVYGGTNLVFTPNQTICHDLYDFDRDYTSEELHGRSLIDPARFRMRWLLHDDEPERVRVGAAFVDACAGNYAHWLTEVLPRIAMFCGWDHSKDIPLVVNAGLHENIMESLYLIAGPDREIFTLPVGRALHVDSLYVTSAVGYVPFGQRDEKAQGHSHGIFSPQAFEKIRNQVVPYAKELSNQAWPEKIYLRRNSGTRQVTNAPELEDLLSANGFVVVESENLSFVEQVQMFNSANEIISPTGAALANAIFCRPGARLGVLMAKHSSMIYRYWLNMLGPLGVNVSYMLCEIERNQHLGLHADFVVDTAHVEELLASWSQE